MKSRTLIGDNLSSHISHNVIESCKKNDINFILLPPNATHLCQPLDVAFFAPLRGKCRKALHKWKFRNMDVISKFEFPGVLKHVLDNLTNIVNNLLSEFAACGIYPLDRDRMLKKFPDHQSDEAVSNLALNESFVNILKDARVGHKENRRVERKRSC
ncbi:hypothetical protein NQ314_001926 [Rhamnusium bicolor]|uniref:DDE-1 domain-containing protein n=1 Tax=Rhamnusium bicolor TaxID=1586634 RepID=A0AAV8ZU91_9CUCU|nr:hypothetical protein NQ314_001926 [Rhamnusium bicolor]